MTVTGYSADTVRADASTSPQFISWIDERGIDSPTQIIRPMVERYQRHLFYYRKTDGRHQALACRRSIWPLSESCGSRWLTRQHHILANPAADLDLPRQPKRLPGRILSAAEVEAVLREADPSTAQGLRDRTLLELLYATGIRRSEVASLDLYAQPRNCCAACCGCATAETATSAVVPLGTRAMAWLEKYLTQAAPSCWRPTRKRCSSATTACPCAPTRSPFRSGATWTLRASTKERGHPLAAPCLRHPHAGGWSRHVTSSRPCWDTAVWGPRRFTPMSRLRN